MNGDVSLIGIFFYLLQKKAQYKIFVNTNNKSKWYAVRGLIYVVLGSKCRADPDNYQLDSQPAGATGQ